MDVYSRALPEVRHHRKLLESLVPVDLFPDYSKGLGRLLVSLCGRRTL
ncbi:MAG: hypothetical protein R2941_22730 [Desulfobacterales bacterium]